MSEPSKQDHWAQLALELGLSVPEPSGPKEPSSEPSAGSASEESLRGASSESLEGAVPKVSTSPKVSGEASRPGEVRPAAPEKAPAPVGPSSIPGQGANHWLEVARQLGLELPPEKPSGGGEGKPPAERISSVPGGQPLWSESPTTKAPSGIPSEEKGTGLPEKTPGPAWEPGAPRSVEAFSEARGAAGEELPGGQRRKEKRRRKKHRRPKHRHLVHRDKSVPVSQQGEEESEAEEIPPTSEGIFADSAWENRAPGASDTQEGLPAGGREDQPVLSETAGAALSGRAESVLVPGPAEGEPSGVRPSGRGEDPSEEESRTGLWPEGRSGEDLSAEGVPEWIQEGVEMISMPPSPLESAAEEPILLPPPPEPAPGALGAEPTPSPLGTEQTGSCEAIPEDFSSSAGSTPSEVSEPFSLFVEPEEILPSEDLFESPDLQEQAEEEEAADAPGKESGPVESEKQIHRGVPTWKEVMDLIISTNLQARSRRGDRGGAHGRGGASRSGH